jgi:hypothetical protein
VLSGVGVSVAVAITLAYLFSRPQSADVVGDMLGSASERDAAAA